MFINVSKKSNRIFFYILFLGLSALVSFLVFNNKEREKSLVGIGYANKTIEYIFKDIITSLDFFELFIDECKGADRCLKNKLMSMVKTKGMNIGEFFFVSENEREAHFFNRDFSGLYSLDTSFDKVVISMIDIDGIKISEPYFSKTTGKYSILASRKYFVFSIFVEVDISSYFEFLKDNNKFLIISPVSNKIIYPYEASNYFQGVLKVDLGTKIESWVRYINNGGFNQLIWSDENIFGWIVLRSVGFYKLYSTFIYIVAAFVILLAFISFFVEDGLDHLSGLKRRDSFRANRLNKNVKAICLLDIDNFKNINDMYGHDIGDETIRAFSCCLKNNIGKKDVAFRWGGEEFLLIIRGGLGEYIDIECVLENLRLSVENMDIEGIPDLTVSIGYCEYEFNVDAKLLIKQADLALYNSKRRGRNKVSGCNYKLK